ncbi:translation initiation factor IF-2-like [Panicum virgatum]|uniref:translation initiation factor IF-2-like n=1 Tax=Panicum virgatum TaxID=38727 RepID=UPI0019D5B6EB|nr:translation initiation factor IF-2-like [Panicum virgatum]
MASASSPRQRWAAARWGMEPAVAPGKPCLRHPARPPPPAPQQLPRGDPRPAPPIPSATLAPPGARRRSFSLHTSPNSFILVLLDICDPRASPICALTTASRLPLRGAAAAGPPSPSSAAAQGDTAAGGAGARSGGGGAAAGGRHGDGAACGHRAGSCRHSRRLAPVPDQPPCHLTLHLRLLPCASPIFGVPADGDSCLSKPPGGVPESGIVGSWLTLDPYLDPGSGDAAIETKYIV